jgi:PucR C-terminal helix-turn-helix domain/GGDEF-like domain
MTNSAEKEPWRDLPPTVADLIEPELEPMTEEILTMIARNVPEYARPLESRFGRGVRTGVGNALSQFVALIRDPDAGRELSREIYAGLGREELREGRTLDSLQAAYRVGARVAWRRISRVGRETKLDAAVLSLLAEAVFAYIDELAADSVDGYAEAQAEIEGERRRHQRQLATLLVREPAADPSDLRGAAQAAGWALPGTVAAIACAAPTLAQVARKLPTDVLATQLEDTGCLFVPDPDGPGRMAILRRAVSGVPLAIGPTTTLAQLRDSWALAKATLRAMEAGTVQAGCPTRAEDHLADLLLFEGNALATRIAARRLAPFASLTQRACERMRETALAYIRHRGNAVAMAAELHVHPQTARYRMARLYELFGDDLDDPDVRFELEIALRATS